MKNYQKDINYLEVVKICLKKDDIDYSDIRKIAVNNNFKYKMVEDAVLFSEVVKKIEKEVNNNKLLYSELLIDYKEILEKTYTLSKELKLKNSLELSILFSHLLWNGYFSENKQFQFQKDGRKHIRGLYSLDIMKGIGVCLDISDIHKNFLNVCGFDSIIINNGRYKLFGKNEFGNHASTLIKENDKFYIYDVTNSTMLKIKNCCNAKSIKGKRYKLYLCDSYYINTGESEYKLLKEFKEVKDFSCPYCKEDYTNTKLRCSDLFDQNSNLLLDYHFSTKDNVDSIVKKLSLDR